MADVLRARFWELPLSALTKAEWEALCDGCGKCCLHKAEDEETGRVYFSNIRCKMLDGDCGGCTDYKNRRVHVPDCVTLTPETVGSLAWLPRTCAYRLRDEGEALPAWHYLVCGDREAVHAAGESVRGWTVPEAEGQDIEDHLVSREI
ncbi:YcgN family cysteine cluster protein [Sphingobium sp. DEHP117]|uniref:YcgN family cysteine cluster protein n=1 Tax=Sphingobium sp. DEHP117 TaxID=2993436 RepID=UPI0027D74B90|nr:YcgN family cysteine cluster protein [Sphingobium sp. DEHP117]MDQ4421769.1 YcgN family cysteine cluster protein [Sphingobium sp. DEHP117]